MGNTTADAPSAAVGRRHGRGFAALLSRFDWRRNIIYIAFVAIFVLFAVLLGDDGFLSQNNLLNVFRQTATITIIAVGMTYVIACAEIDLSVGSVAGLSSVCCAMASSSAPSTVAWSACSGSRRSW